METIPVIDLRELSTKTGRVPSRENWSLVAGELGKALSTIGFAYVINHDVDPTKVCVKVVNKGMMANWSFDILVKRRR